MDEVLNAELFSDLYGLVGRAIINNKPFDFIDTRQGLRHLFEDKRQRFFFIQARDLDKYFHSFILAHGYRG
jgi:hypothetical protein